MIPLFANRLALEPLLGEVAERQRAVIESGRYILGPEVEAFEREFAAYLGCAHCVGVANGTEALTIGLRALGVKAGDEVVVPDFTFFATAEAVLNAGATPVFADIDPETHCLTAETAAPAITDRTTAIVPVHIFGNPAPMGELLELAAAHGLRVLEDAAQAAGARLDGRMAGAIGHAGAFSFYPGKNLGAFGDGGALVTDDEEVAAVARRLRVHGTAEPWTHTEAGYNSRLDEVQAAALRVLLPQLEEWTQARRRVADAYASEGLGDLVRLSSVTAGAESAFHLYTVCTTGRDELIDELAAAEIESRAYYTVPMHRQPAIGAASADQAYPNAERLAAEGISLPMGPSLAAEEVAEVVGAIRRAMDGRPGKTVQMR